MSLRADPPPLHEANAPSDLLGVPGEQLPPGHPSVPGVQLQLLLPGGSPDWPGSGLSASHGRRRPVSGVLSVSPSSFSKPLILDGLLVVSYIYI